MERKRLAEIERRVASLRRIDPQTGMVRRTFIEALDELNDRGVISDAEQYEMEMRRETANHDVTEAELLEMLPRHPWIADILRDYAEILERRRENPYAYLPI